MWHECAEGERPVRHGVLLVSGILRQGAFGAGRLSGWHEDGVVAEAAMAAWLSRDGAGEVAQLCGRSAIRKHQGGCADEGRGAVLVAHVTELRQEQVEVR